jgi:uncharacterized protein (TIGR03083 family)
MPIIPASDELTALEASVVRLRDLVGSFGPDERRAQAYPSEWTVAEVIAHLGSGAEIAILRIDEAFGGPPGDPEPIWNAWNAKDPDAKAADALGADRALIDRLHGLTAEERDAFTMSMGPMNLDFQTFARLRLNEHVLHSWDVAVTFEPAAALADDAVPLILETLPMIAGFAGKPTGATRQLRVATTEPDRRFIIDLRSDGVSLAPSTGREQPHLGLPAEALIRLVYGRLDKDHTPSVTGAADDLEELRRAFPGV